MDGEARPTIRVRLSGGSAGDGEIGLDDLGRIATETQGMVRRLARSMVDRRTPGRAPKAVDSATQLTLVGLHTGSTVLEIAAPVASPGMLEAEDMPLDLGPRTLGLFMEAVEAVASADKDLPAGFDAHSARDLDRWLRDVQGFHTVALESNVGGSDRAVELAPKMARRHLKQISPSPPLPFVTASLQSLSGRLYAVNLNTGTFSIEDATERKIRINVPESLRNDAGALINRIVSAVGTPLLDEAGKLHGFEVRELRTRPDLEGINQEEFFKPHEIEPRAASKTAPLREWAIEGLTEEERESFDAALSELR